MAQKSKAMMVTHLPLLLRVFTESEGDVLEMGTGYFSTLVFHWLAEMSKRRIVSYESQESWYQKALKYHTGTQEIIKVDNWDNAPIESQHWGMAFVDHHPNHRRHIDIKRLANNADFIVIHDTELEHDNQYHYTEVFPLFKYRYDFTKFYPYTSVVSNFKDLSNL